VHKNGHQKDRLATKLLLAPALVAGKLGADDAAWARAASSDCSRPSKTLNTIASKSNKREYKKQLNELRTGTKVSAPTLSKEKIEALEKQQDAERLKSAQALTERINKIPLPAERKEVLDFLNERSGPIKKNQGQITRLKKLWAADSAVLAELARAQGELDKKAAAAALV
jgi:hypothetical protein